MILVALAACLSTGSLNPGAVPVCLPPTLPRQTGTEAFRNPIPNPPPPVAWRLRQGERTGSVDIAAFRKAIAPISVNPASNLKDLDPLKSALKDATVVGLGEVTHGSKEIFEVKHRVFRFLVEKMGYTVLALEASMVQSMALDRYVMTGEGSAAAALKETGFWTVETEEVAALIEWMRAYNKDPKNKKKLRVIGFDAQESTGMWIFLSRKLRSYGVKDPILDDEIWFRNLQGDNLTEEVLDQVRKMVENNKSVLLEKYGPEGVEILRRLPVTLRQAWISLRPMVLQEDLMDGAQVVQPILEKTLKGAGALLEKSSDLPDDAKAGLRVLVAISKGGQKPDFRVLYKGAEALEGKEGELGEAGSVMKFLAMGLEMRSYGKLPRDAHLAENVQWIAKTLLPGSKMAVWAHNSHVSRYRMEGEPLMMGAYLSDALKNRYYPLATAFLEGGFLASVREKGVGPVTVGPAKAGSLDALLGTVSSSPFYLNFEGLPAKLRAELSTPFPMRAIGSGYREETPDLYYEKMSPATVFSGMLFVPKIAAAKRLP